MPSIRQASVNVTPLIDIVMCMIVFFMLVAKIGVDTGGDRDVVVPASFLGVDLKDLGNTLTLNVRNGAGVVGGEAQPLITWLQHGTQQELQIRSEAEGRTVYPLYETLKRFKDGDPATGLRANPNFKVIIRADANTEYQFLQPVLAECTRAGVSYDFATQKGEVAPQ
jgi:biopolymer transport protein ExbD